MTMRGAIEPSCRFELGSDAVARVIGSVSAPQGSKLELAAPLDVAHNALNRTLNFAVEGAEGRRARTRDLNEVRKLVAQIGKAKERMGDLLHRPPLPDQSTVDRLHLWMYEEQKWIDHSSGGGRQRDPKRDALIRDCLICYFRSFDRKPSGAEDGPTIRFVSAFLSEGQSWCEQYRPKKVNSPIWRRHSAGALGKKIKRLIEAERMRSPPANLPPDVAVWGGYINGIFDGQVT